MALKCIKCGMTSRKKTKGVVEDYICQDCKQHGEFIISLYEQAREIFSDSSKNIENSDIYTLLKNTYFIVQKNPKLSVYQTLTKELLDVFGVENYTEIDYDELWKRTKSTRNLMRILISMEDADIVKIESPTRIRRIIKPNIVLENFIKIYKPYKTQEQAKIRVATVLSMYSILHELYLLAMLNSRVEIEEKFGPHVPKAPWVATMFLWTGRVTKKTSANMFTEEEMRRFFVKRGLSSTTISNYAAALKATAPYTVQQYIDNIEVTNGNTIKFIIHNDIINILERIYSARVRESERT